LNFIVGARGSKLSLAQTNWVILELQKIDPSLLFEIKSITTKGDTDTRPLFAMEQKGIFEKEIDRAVFEKEIDFAVHSLKDVPSKLDPDLTIACVPKREAINDVLITREGFDIKSVPSGSVIGSSSLRRAVQVMRQRPDLVVKPVRGNIETRINKVTDGKFDGIVLAQAGITRLGTNVKFSKLSPDDFPPSPGQGALAIVSRKDNSNTLEMLKKIEHYRSRMEIEAERALSESVDSGCRFPVGAFAVSNFNSLTLKVAVYSMNGKKSIVLEKTGELDKPKELGKLLGTELIDKGVKDIASNWREELEEWNKQ
jgi:hydroxymethylbilane synthase|tara:strand:- start:1783 stop:2718 length:936 start_codon:yes stop_codon:yes gene_type:complete